MAEFCLDCWNKINKTEENEKKYVLSKDLDLCEGCGEWKRVIIMERKAYYMYNHLCFVFLLNTFESILNAKAKIKSRLDVHKVNKKRKKAIDKCKKP